MNDFELNIRVSKEIERWTYEQRDLGKRIEFSENSKNLIVEIIQNIENDPSRFWVRQRNLEFAQERAISKISDALNMLLQRSNRLQNRDFDIYLSPWEIYMNLTPILIEFCFIPERDM